MRRALLVLCFLLAPAALVFASVPRPRSPAVVTITEPDPRKAAPLERWPTDEDLARLNSAIGQSRASVLRLLGHPFAVGRQADGTEVWCYAWQAACRVYFKNGVCTRTLYIAGF